MIVIHANRGLRRALLLVAAVWFATHPAQAQKAPPLEAGGSLPLTDLLTVAKPYPNLVNEVRLALLAAGLTKEKVACTGRRFPNAWVNLGGRRVAPYDCRIGRRRLLVSSVAVYFDRNGHKLVATDPDLTQKAARLTEARLTWAWK